MKNISAACKQKKNVIEIDAVSKNKFAVKTNLWIEVGRHAK